MVPCQRKTRTQGKKRRSQQALAAPHYVLCPYSGKPKRPHSACPETGYVPPKGNRGGFFVFKQKEQE